MDDRREQQLRLEAESVELGVAHFRRRQSRLKPSETKASEDFIQACFEQLSAAIAEEQRRVVQGEISTKLRKHDVPLLSLHADKLALITLRSILNGVQVKSDDGSVRTLARVAKDVGRTCERERRLDRKLSRARDVSSLLTERNRNRWNALQRAQALALAADTDWAADNRDLRLGIELIDLAVKHCVIHQRAAFEMEEKRPNPTMLRLRMAARVWLEGRGAQHEHMAPPLQQPMIVPPEPWESLWGGGYLTDPTTSLVKRLRYGADSSAFKGSDLSSVFSAVNTLQVTAWQINRFILNAISDSIKRGLELPGLELKRRQLPTNLGSDASEEVLKRHKGERARVHQWNAQVAGNRQITNMRVAMGKRLLGQEPLYFPYQLDGRGRVYPIPPVFNPQSDDFGRALLEFHRAEPLGVIRRDLCPVRRRNPS